MSVTTVDRIYEQTRRLAPGERLRLVERIVHDLSVGAEGLDVQPRPSWNDVRGIAPDLLGGEDAQEWVTRTRRESDETRDDQMRRWPSAGR